MSSTQSNGFIAVLNKLIAFCGNFSFIAFNANSHCDVFLIAAKLCKTFGINCVAICLLYGKLTSLFARLVMIGFINDPRNFVACGLRG